MRQSYLFSSTRKEIPKGEESKNAILLTRGGYIDKEMAGVYTLLPLGFRVAEKVKTIVREELDKLPHTSEMLMPVLQLHALWEESGRREKIKDIMYDLKDEPIGLGPTHEEVITDIFRRFFHSYKDVPKAAYQIQIKFRHEPRAKSGLLRGREFMMKDLYSFHGTEEDFQQYYELVQQAYLRIYQRCGLHAILTDALGGVFSKYSHEFQVLAENGEDTVYLDQSGDRARNKEVVEDENDPAFLEFCEGIIDKRSAIEVGNIFPLIHGISEPMDASITGKNGEKSDVWMGCYGIGITRLIGTVVEVYGNLDKGLIPWPEAIAPFKIHLIELGQGLGQDLHDKLVKLPAPRSSKSEVGDKLDKSGILYDDRDESAGTKFADADLIGAPIRLVVSHRTGDKIECTIAGHTQLINRNELVDHLTNK